MKNAIMLVAGLIALVIIPRLASAYWDWADHFCSGQTSIEMDNVGSGHFLLQNQFDELSPDSAEPNAWSNIGAQTVGGRFNAVESVQVDIKETNSSACASFSVTIQRYRDTTPPAEGATCNASSTTGNPVVAAATTTYNTCGNGNNDPTYIHRDNTALNFASESTAPVGSVYGYVNLHRLFITGTSMPSGPHDIYACYKIWWFAP